MTTCVICRRVISPDVPAAVLVASGGPNPGSWTYCQGCDRERGHRERWFEELITFPQDGANRG